MKALLTLEQQDVSLSADIQELDELLHEGAIDFGTAGSFYPSQETIQVSGM